MARTARASVGGICYHVINRGNGRSRVYRKDADYAAFTELMALANERLAMRVLGYGLMPNHFHLVLWPRKDGDLSRWMQWLMTLHVRRYHGHYRTSGHVWQGRFKAFPIEQDGHLLTVLRYVERNPVRAGLVRRAQEWVWSSARAWGRQAAAGLVHDWPVERPRDWLAWVNRAEPGAELQALRSSVNRGTPYGSAGWVLRTAKRLELEASIHPRGRPRQEIK